MTVIDFPSTCSATLPRKRLSEMTREELEALRADTLDSMERLPKGSPHQQFLSCRAEDITDAIRDLRKPWWDGIPVQELRAQEKDIQQRLDDLPETTDTLSVKALRSALSARLMKVGEAIQLVQEEQAHREDADFEISLFGFDLDGRGC